MDLGTSKIWPISLYLVGAIILVIFFIFAMPVLINLFRGKDKNVNENEQMQNINAKLEQLEKINNESKKPTEIAGPAGPIGEQGPAGGIYTQQGPLRNLAQVDMVVDRMEGYGAMSRPYLATQNYNTQQTWTLMSDKNDVGGVLKNQYGGCLAVDKANSVYMMPSQNCNTTAATKWLFTSQGNLVPFNDKKKCLSFTNTGMIKNLVDSNKVNLKGKNVNMFNNLLELNLTDCDSNLNQKWSFY